MGFFDEYKPFRNYMTRFALVPSLLDIWRYSLHIVDGQPLPTDYATGKNAATFRPLSEHLHPWDLDVLAREVVLNAGVSGERSLRRWGDLATAVNHIRRLEGASYRHLGQQADALLELHRIAHRQFPWQIRMGQNAMLRIAKIFGEAMVEAIVVRELGMTAKQFFLLGAALGGHFQSNWGMSVNQDYGVLGIAREASDAFLNRVTCDLRQLRAETVSRQSYDADWLYTWNPLEATPLVRFDVTHPDRVLCPIPAFLLRRVTSGLFYDLVRSVGFDNPYGHAFQAYVGEVIAATCPPPRFTALAEEPYKIGSQTMHGTDWVLSDSTGHLFVECKTKRLTVNARTLSDTEALNEELHVLAKAIVQHYRNIRDAVDGRTRWRPNGLPVFALVLTLEDWFILSPRVREILTRHVHDLLAKQRISERVLEEIPYTVASAHEFEVAAQIIGQAGICALMSAKTAPKHRSWSLLPFMQTEFWEQMRSVNWHLFPNDWDRLWPEPT